MAWLGNGLSSAKLHTDALSVREAQFSMMKRLGAPEHYLLVTQSNLASTYRTVGRYEESMRLRRDAYSGCARLYGEEHAETLIEANNLANLLEHLERFEEVKSLLRRSMPVARRVLGASHDHTLRMRCIYAQSLYWDTGAALADLREAVTTLEEIERTARRVLGGAHPKAAAMERSLQAAREALRAREAGETLIFVNARDVRKT